MVVINILIAFYTYKKLQGSQTPHEVANLVEQFYTYKKLQGSQTAIML